MSALDEGTQTAGDASVASEAGPLEKKEGLWHPVGGLVEEVDADDDSRPGGGGPPPPAKLGVATRAKFHEVLPFETFALSDEGDAVKVYFGLKGAKATLPPDGVKATFRVQALEVVARPSKTRTYRCHESILYEHVVPDKCKVKIKTDHVLIIMPKVYTHASWSQLGVNRKAIGPVRKSPPDFGAATVVTAGGNGAPFEDDDDTQQSVGGAAVPSSSSSSA